MLAVADKFRQGSVALVEMSGECCDELVCEPILLDSELLQHLLADHSACTIDQAGKAPLILKDLLQLYGLKVRGLSTKEFAKQFGGLAVLDSKII